ncbi:YczE/YyaS/YitT family protein [Sediminibacillus massiliensis]|uniref:YczE/YyaS/YitT family protein n=1 Tax=Sediminibacillus massiliensis TaxID=1926277 RepID=UPI001FE82371|nr:YitT family protein [Sediminibacillus massiliensis]
MKELLIRWAFLLSGIIILALGITLTIKAKDLGISPWDVFHYGLFLKLGLTIGVWSIVSGLVIVLITFIFTKTIPKIGTFLNMVLIGVFIDIFNWTIPSFEDFWMEVFLFLTGIFITACGVGIYVAPGLGAGPRDSVMLNLSDWTGWRVSYVRSGIELIICMIGWLLGGPVGMGTILIVLCLGPLVGITMPSSVKLMNFLIRRGERDENLNQRALRINHHD